MKRLVAVACTVAVLATACGREGDNSPAEAPSIPAYHTNEYVAAPSGSDLHECKTRMVSTNDGEIGLKNVSFRDGDIHFYFTPEKSVYESYTLKAMLDHGVVYATIPNASVAEVKYELYDGTGVHPVDATINKTINGSKHTISIVLPNDFRLKFGFPKVLSAAINGSHAGTCEIEK
ncbi:hypothetical protein [Corynebacterium ulcerans]|uniref:hypothetical protein n=1 Tax=Corynebacterium ulcerans TaxID=65058 RepID=UPI0002141BCE|nr:hypothetical protein [Corynebacterium ulcerans]AEG84408.1 putative secreted protein [Corynebacterium ulcerans BR-AD22]